MNVRLISFALLASSTACLHAKDWTRFRGENGQGISADKVPIEWSAEKNLKWKLELPGMGSSSAVIAGGKVFVTCFSGVGGDSTDTTKLVRHLVCADLKTGKVLWERKVANKQKEDPYGGFLKEHGYASNTPVVHDGKVYAFFGKSGLHAFDLDGKPLWDKNLGTGSTRRKWGSAASPIVVGDTLVVSAAEEDLTVYGLDLASGKEKWKAEGDALEMAYGTPVVMDSGEGRTDIVLPVPGEIWGMNPANGKLRWFAETEITGNVSPSPVLGGGTVYVFGGYPRTARTAVQVDGAKGEIPADRLLWDEKDSSYVPTPVLVDGHLYWASDSGYACCAEAESGDLIFKERLNAQASGSRGKPFYAAAVVSDGKVICVSRWGGCFVFEAKPEFKLLAHNKLDGDDSQFHGTPAISDGQLLLRSDKFLYCIGD
ncbi:MAG: PQQ-binding-like beta-propeller repeat protein [Verrucomicrobiales bacterium]